MVICCIINYLIEGVQKFEQKVNNKYSYLVFMLKGTLPNM